MNSDIHALRQKANALEFPECMVMPEERIPGMAFFPCGPGLFDPSRKLSDIPIMIIGQDQDSEKYFSSSLRQGKETSSSTWRNLTGQLKDSRIPEHECFFTNFIIGIRKGKLSNTGISPALKHPMFIAQCAEFMIDQISAQRPKAIITLGKVPLHLLGLISNDVRLSYTAVENFNDIHNRPALEYITFETIPDYKTKFCPISHPSSKRGTATQSRQNRETKLLTDLYGKL